MRRLVEYARDPRRSAWIGFCWGLAEGTFFFIVPDVWIGLAAMYSPASGVAAWAASILGTGMAAGALWIAVRFGVVPEMLVWIPGIPAAMIDRVTVQIGAGGLPWDPAFVLGGVPFKLYAVVFLSAHRPFAALLAWVVFARLVRIAPTVAVAAALRTLLRDFIERRYRIWIMVYGLFWTLFYLLLWSTRLGLGNR